MDLNTLIDTLSIKEAVDAITALLQLGVISIQEARDMLHVDAPKPLVVTNVP